MEDPHDFPPRPSRRPANLSWGPGTSEHHENPKMVPWPGENSSDPKCHSFIQQYTTLHLIKRDSNHGLC
jgi:hypothetical protein